MEFSRPGSTIAKALWAMCIMATPASSFAWEVSLGVDNIVVHDMGYRMVYQSKVLSGVSLGGGYPLSGGLSVVGALGFAPSWDGLGAITAGLYIVGLGAGVRYTPPPLEFILRPYVAGKAGVLFGWTDFSDGHTRLQEVSFAVAGDVVAGIELPVVRRTWGRIAVFCEFGWEEASPLNFGGFGGVDIRGVLSRIGGFMEF